MRADPLGSRISRWLTLPCGGCTTNSKRHLTKSPGSVGTVFAYQQICGSPYVAVGDHLRSLLCPFISHKCSSSRKGSSCFSRYLQPSAKSSFARQSPTRKCACCRSGV